MLLAILQIAGSVLGMLATWYVGKQVVKWLQAYRTYRQGIEQDRLKRETENLAKDANRQSDQLKDIEGR